MSAAFRLQADADLGRRNTFGVPARAPWLLEVDDHAALAQALDLPQLRGLPLLVLGGGSNLLFAGDPPGAVLALHAAAISRLDEEGTRVRVRAEAGVRIFDQRYRPTDDIAGHLHFALKHEALDLLVLSRVLGRMGPEAVTDIVGANNVINPIEPTMGAEDFAFMLQQRPGCYLFIGNGDGGHREAGHGLGPCMLHNPSYDFNDELIPIGATLWTRMVERFLPVAP